MDVQSVISLFHPLSEKRLIDLKPASFQEKFARALLLLAVLYGKWRGIKDNDGFRYVLVHAGSELWIGSIFPCLDSWLNESTTWEETLKEIITQFILDRHDVIMYEKKRLDSCWLHRVEGRIYKDQDYSATWRSSRHNNVISILRDLNLINVSEDDNIQQTTDGNSIFKDMLQL